MNKPKINIGFDIGVASVGWSLIDENGKIIKLGVRLFDDVANAKDGKLKNEERRSARCLRRRLRRIKTRKQAFLNFLVDKKWVDSYEQACELINIDISKFNANNPIELKVRALKEKISKDALIYILFHYIHHRGKFYETAESLKEKNSDSNEVESTKLFPSQKIYNFYLENNYYKDSKIADEFFAFEYEEEIRKILEVQQINDKSFIEEYIKIFSAVRSFETGPGSEKSPTPYGMYYRDEKGNIQKRNGNNLWDALKGICTYYNTKKYNVEHDEFRGGKNSPTAELFNLINDINNIYFFKSSEMKFNSDDKKFIFDEYSKCLNEIFKGKKLASFNLDPKKISKLASNFHFEQEIKIDNVDGYRINTKGEKIITELSTYNKIIEWMIKNNRITNEINILDLELLKEATKVYELLASTTDVNSRIKKLKETYSSSKESNEKLAKLKGLSQTHSLSYKAMEDFISFAINNLDLNENQMVFFEREFNSKRRIENNKSSKYLDKNIFNDEVISPTTRRAFIQTIRVMNKLLKTELKNYEIDNITFELPRDKNSAEEAKSISNSQKKNRDILFKILSENGYSNPDEEIKKFNGKTKIAIKLWEQQNYHDIYDGEYIEFKDVINISSINPKLQVDHIIPISISHDDSINNKVLTKTFNNKSKSNLTPYLWLKNSNKFEEFKNRVDATYNTKETKDKAEILKSELDPNTESKNFIARNLVDTRYASRLVMNTFQDFFRNNEQYGHVKVKAIRGSITSFARYNLFVENKKTLIPKDRDVYCHHAIDASIVGWLGMNHKIKLLLGYASSNENNFVIDNETGEVIKIGEIIKNSKNFYESMQDEKTRYFGNQLKDFNTIVKTNENDKKTLEYGSRANEVRYSRMYTTKKNVPLSNQTIYSIRWKLKDDNGNKIDNPTTGNLILKLKLLEDTSKLPNYFSNEKKNIDDVNSLLCKKNNEKLYNSLCTIYNQYYKDTKTNPFITYMQYQYEQKNPNLTQDEIKKYNPKWIDIDGVRVSSLKYIGDKKDISNTIVLNSHNNRALLESLNSLEIRIYKDNKNKYVVIPINQKVLNFNNKTKSTIVDENKLNKLLNEKNIINTRYIPINVGTIFIHKETNQLYYSSSGYGSILELKSLFAINELSMLKGRYQRPISTIISNFYIAEVDELGNIYNCREISIN